MPPVLPRVSFGGRTVHLARDEAGRTLLHKLARELFRTETSVVMNSRREAERLGAVPAGIAMIDVAQHADAVLGVLPELFEGRGAGKLGVASTLIPFAISLLRRLGLDWAFGHERSYRQTLLGQRHGIDLVYELEHLAMELKDEQLAEWCRGWLERRVPLVTEVERQLQWFVTHPDRALEGA